MSCPCEGNCCNCCLMEVVWSYSLILNLKLAELILYLPLLVNVCTTSQKQTSFPCWPNIKYTCLCVHERVNLVSMFVFLNCQNKIKKTTFICI